MTPQAQRRFSLFGTGVLQVSLVAVNTFQIAHEKYIGVLIVGFLISLVWSFNVRRVAFGSTTDRIVYAAGASLGTLIGLVAAKFLYS